MRDLPSGEDFELELPENFGRLSPDEKTRVVGLAYRTADEITEPSWGDWAFLDVNQIEAVEPYKPTDSNAKVVEQKEEK